MINQITGQITHINEIQDKSIHIQVGPIGFAVFVPNETIYLVGQDISLEIYFYWNQENGPQLYGFESILEKQVFSLIISCSGIGPKIGLAALNQLSPEQIINYILSGDIKSLSKITGIGAKKAELIITQLKDKSFKLSSKIPVMANNLGHKLKLLSDILGSLNYTTSEVKIALDNIKKAGPDFSGPETSIDDLLRKSLMFLVKLKN